MTKPSQAQVREINRTLLATVRADWRFPDNRVTRQTTLEPLTYRERYYSTSDDDGSDHTSSSEAEKEDSDEEETEEPSWSSPETELEVNPLDEEGAQTSSKGKKKRKFSCPDDVAVYLERKLQSRKRRKMRTLEEELSWNKGLCFFMRRRNAWTGALSQDEVKSREEAKARKSKDEKRSDVESEASHTDGKDQDESSSNNSDTDSGIEVSPPSPAPADETPAETSPFDPPSTPDSFINVMVPISIPFLPANHPVRSSIMARTHSELYEKIVRDSRTPAVPLNLAHMMRVIVQGWKDEGNWPPKSAMAEAGIATKKKVKAGSSAKTTDNKGVGLFVGHKHLQRGVESVRRALRLSGSAPPAGD